jgi:hypothetical protein
MVNKVLLIGINYTGTNHELGGCINDVENMEKYLRKHYYVDKIKIMTDNHNGRLHPTKRNIIRQLKWLTKGAKPGDNLFLHYSGHGTQINDDDWSEEDGKDECICPIDGGIIKDDHLHRYLVNSISFGVKLLCVFDCCHSASILDLKYKYLSSNSNKKSFFNYFWKNINSNKKNNNYTESNSNVITISGCLDDSQSSDAHISGQRQGAMTYSLLTTLKANPQINYGDLIDQMNILLKRKRYSQRPQLYYSTKMNMNTRVELL